MSNPRIEEVEDDVSDPEEMDLDAFDFAKPQGSLQSSQIPSDPSGTQINPEELQRILGQQQQPGGGPPGFIADDKERQRMHREQVERTKAFQCIYPVYFDASRSRDQGRRVSKEDAVENPLARTIVDALQHIGKAEGLMLQAAFEPAKTHPKDWANPGRIKVMIKQDGKPVNKKLQSKAHLYKLIAEYMKSHPTTQESPLKLKIHGLPPPKDGKVPLPAVPRGSRMGSVLPLHSPALTGGGVSDTFLQDMMSQMGGQMPPGMIAPPGAAGGSSGGKKKR